MMPTTSSAAPARSAAAVAAAAAALRRGLRVVLVFNGLLAAWLVLRPAPPAVHLLVTNVAMATGLFLVLPWCWRRPEGGGQRRRAAPALLGLGIAGWALGECIWTFYRQMREESPVHAALPVTPRVTEGGDELSRRLRVHTLVQTLVNGKATEERFQGIVQSIKHSL